MHMHRRFNIIIIIIIVWFITRKGLHQKDRTCTGVLHYKYNTNSYGTLQEKFLQIWTVREGLLARNVVTNF